MAQAAAVQEQKKKVVTLARFDLGVETASGVTTGVTAKQGYSIEVGQVGVSVSKDGHEVLVPWSNVTFVRIETV